MRPFYYPELAYAVDFLENAIIVYKILGYKMSTEWSILIWISMYVRVSCVHWYKQLLFIDLEITGEPVFLSYE